ncbi:hypothetical protein H261_09707 [Paramagnetospirillum caucaseum]|uniref:Uncharacterized protein n=1 Tax=Paramagnetospirillum caucaseum TaxID=1244869 RepID=M2Z7B2_9PROT|nr:hypothetical protein [Paramagnetospirillum caucaseum]EME70200.1 hypothetical protein H261_09707 [Paramagnetospirillum caucaseum]
MSEFQFSWSRFNDLQRRAAAEDLTDHEAEEYDTLARVWEEAKAEGRRREGRQVEEQRQRQAEENPSDPDGSVGACLAEFQRTRDQQRGVTWHRAEMVEVRNPDGRSTNRQWVGPGLAGQTYHQPSASRGGLDAIKRGLAA